MFEGFLSGVGMFIFHNIDKPIGSLVLGLFLGFVLGYLHKVVWKKETPVLTIWRKQDDYKNNIHNR